jgi:thiol-disulfide isomerase/thioredoxin
MSTGSETPPSPSRGDEPRSPGRRRHRLDARTIGICVCIALIAGILAGLLVSFVGGSDDDAGGNATGTPRADLTPDSDVDRTAALDAKVTTFEDEATTVGAYLDGKPLVVNLWASTCVPCIKEMPAIEKVHQRNRSDVAFLGVDVQDQKADGLAMIDRTGVTYPSVQDRSGSFARSAEAAGLPTTLLIDADGEVVASHLGALTESKLQDLIDTKLG